MPALLREALLVLLVGLALGATHGVLRGFPHPPVQVEANSCSAPVPDEPTIRWISQEDAHQRQLAGTATFVDARTEAEYQNGHIAGALHAPLEAGVLNEETLAELRGLPFVITYCDTSTGCASSTRLAGLLAVEGLREVRVLEGGMPAWLENGFPAEAGACRDCR